MVKIRIIWNHHPVNPSTSQHCGKSEVPNFVERNSHLFQGWTPWVFEYRVPTQTFFCKKHINAPTSLNKHALRWHSKQHIYNIFQKRSTQLQQPTKKNKMTITSSTICELFIFTFKKKIRPKIRKKIKPSSLETPATWGRPNPGGWNEWIRPRSATRGFSMAGP